MLRDQRTSDDIKCLAELREHYAMAVPLKKALTEIDLQVGEPPGSTPAGKYAAPCRPVEVEFLNDGKELLRRVLVQIHVT